MILIFHVKYYYLIHKFRVFIKIFQMVANITFSKTQLSKMVQLGVQLLLQVLMRK